MDDYQKEILRSVSAEVARALIMVALNYAKINGLSETDIDAAYEKAKAMGKVRDPDNLPDPEVAP